MLSNDELFCQIDGRHADILGNSWQIEVCGIHQEGASRWVQLSVNGPEDKSLTVRLAPTDGPQHVMMAVSTWLVWGACPTNFRDVA